jgi:hypothetical protein
MVTRHFEAGAATDLIFGVFALAISMAGANTGSAKVKWFHDLVPRVPRIATRFSSPVRSMPRL